MKKWLLSAAALALTACSQSPNNTIAEVSGLTFVEQVKAQTGKTTIPYQKYVLDNGLTVILHQDNSDPLVHVNVTYHVGSSREELGKSGFAHFFEHMMFQGSEHVADDEHFKIVTEAGGNMNGTTNRDRTNYYQTVPANQLEKMLWLESDRMGFLLKAVTQEKFEVQRETVKNERGQRVDNRPYGRLGERVAQALYPKGHPYSWPTIGYMDDLNRVNVNDLKAFFLNWYGPNNATITIGGDIDTKETLTLVKQYFAEIPTGPSVEKLAKEPVTLTENRYISFEDNIHLPLVYLSFPTAYARHEDEPALDLLASIIGGGKTSLVYKNLVKNQMAVQASTNHTCGELSCSFDIFALPHPASGKSLTEIEATLRQTIAEFEQRGVTDDDLIKAKAAIESSFIFGLQSVQGKVAQLAAYQTFTGTPNYIEQDIKRYNSVTKADVMRVFEQYVKNKPSVIASVVPKGQINAVAAADNFAADIVKLEGKSTTQADDLDLRTTPLTFNRSVKPVAGKNRAVDVPAFWREDFSNGMSMLGTENDETPTTSLLIRIPNGHYAESSNKAGLASITASLMNESTLDTSSEDMAKALQKLGSSISFSAGNSYTNVFVNTLTKNVDPTIALLNEKLFKPAFTEQDFARVRANQLESVLFSQKDAGALARNAFRAIMFDGSIAALPSQGTAASLKTLTLDDVSAFYQQHYNPQRAQIIAVSDLTQAALSQKLTKLKQWQGQSKINNVVLNAPSYAKNTVYLVNKDDATQSAIRVGQRSIKQDITGEFYQLGLVNFALGGNFNSRLNLNLREDKGYTYGAGSSFYGDKFGGAMVVSTAVRADATIASLKEITKELTQYQQQGITADELTFMRNAINQQDALEYETPQAKLNFLAQILEHNLSADFVKERAKIVSTITQSRINELAKQYLDVNDMAIVIVGDAKTLKPQLKALGYDVIDYTAP
ncbi:pitrilysin family protein [Psychrobium sp. 1_MG-2023]|uniref:M16 family metallopeptidase n=1 Tax=Psychrobium sp. 1_MG-2023 TaxID=3062624 RepID=UPI000C339E58|nr:pitrilysin family protein [Psychrobium sp. 1_MG-2023]MDP2559910.1 pitrilysin family protein [Psychrobium sp. 1_MG-2023]PKF58989.1 peptidase M16 [Alteromonadales bacterium alter-6D02]